MGNSICDKQIEQLNSDQSYYKLYYTSSYYFKTEDWLELEKLENIKTIQLVLVL